MVGGRGGNLQTEFLPADELKLNRQDSPPFLLLDSYTGRSILWLETLAPVPFAVSSARQFDRFHHSDAQSGNGSPIIVTLQAKIPSHICSTLALLEHMFSNICS